MEHVVLSNGVKVPKLGFGVFQIPREETVQAVMDAVQVGYRHFDTAQSYMNELELGIGLKESGVKREDLFVTSKIWISNYGYEKTKESVYTSLEKLHTDYLDLMLLHQPFGDWFGSYRALVDLYNEGVLRAIGVSNFLPRSYNRGSIIYRYGASCKPSRSESIQPTVVCSRQHERTGRSNGSLGSICRRKKWFIH